MKTCYMCNNIKTSREHVPPECFFPVGHRNNLITVPSCDIHNSKKSGEDEFFKNIFSSCYGIDYLESGIDTDKIYRSLKNNQRLLADTFHELYLIQLPNGINTCAFPIDQRRLIEFFKMISYGIYYHDFKIKYPGDWYITDDTSFLLNDHRDTTKNDIDDDIRKILRNYPFIEVRTYNPEIFQYFIFKENNKVIYKLIFYRTIIVYSYTR